MILIMIIIIIIIIKKLILRRISIGPLHTSKQFNTTLLKINKNFFKTAKAILVIINMLL